MAVTETKFRLSWIVLSAVFISLSVSAATDQQVEGHRCYWCGPLAEQVHRSQRAPKCNGDKSKTTICDEGLPYCAIVATSPPYVESRFCVKVYQDECYSVYCNSTKTWKVTCPCTGELCNGANTKRENVAFESLLKHNVAKQTQAKRLRRSLVSKANFISPRKNKIDNTTVEQNKEALNETSSPSTVTEERKREEVTNTENDPKPTEQIKNNDSETSKTIGVTEATPEIPTVATVAVTSNEITETPGETTPAKDDSTINEPGKNDASPASVSNTMIVVTIDKESHINEPNIQIDIPSPHIDSDDLKTDIIVMSSETPKEVNEGKTPDTVTKINENVPAVHTTIPVTATTVQMKVTPETTTQMVKATEMEAVDKTKLKSNEKLPAAEALQHNDTPTTKPTEQMFVTTVTTLNLDVSTQATTARNNTATRMDAHIFTILVGIILQY